MGIKETSVYSAIRKAYYAVKNWDTTSDNLKTAWDIRKNHNIHCNQACVVIGNGPSLRVEDLTKLHELGIPTFACNRVHLVFDQTPWRPTYYFMSDPKLIKQYSGEFQGVPDNCRFFPKLYRDVIRHGRFYNVLPFDYEHEGRFSLNAAKGVYPAASVTTEMIQFAYYMGFAEIYLIGVDFSYNVSNVLSGNTYAYQDEKNYFIPGYLKPGEIADLPNINANLLGFHAAREAIEKQKRIICNATRGGKLEVFERVNLDELFEKWEADRK